MPHRLLLGAGDTAAPEIARRASELVKQCVALVVVDGAGHDVHRDGVESAAVWSTT